MTASTTAAEPVPPVDAHPAGASPVGVEDLVGNVWQWTAGLMTEGQHDVVFIRGVLVQGAGGHLVGEGRPAQDQRPSSLPAVWARDEPLFHSGIPLRCR